MGKIELAEHVVMHCATLFFMMPVFGTLGPRAWGRQRIAVELLRSTLWGVQDKRRSQFLAEKHGATLSSVGA